MQLFDSSRYSNFQKIELSGLSPDDPLLLLNVERRKLALLNDPDQGSADWQTRYAQFLYDTGEYEQTIAQANRVADQTNERTRLRAASLECRAQFMLGKGIGAKAHLDIFNEKFADSKDDFVIAFHALVQGAYLAGGATEESDTFPRAIKYFQTAADLFESLGEIDHAILCRIDVAGTFAPAGSYLRAISEIERAMTLATQHSAYQYTGRMLTIASSAAADQGYRRNVEETLHRAIEWCEFVGDFWGRTQALYILGRLVGYQVPSGDPVAAARPERYLLDAIEATEAKGAVGLAAHVTATLAWLYEKSGELDRRQHLLDEENRRSGGRRKHFDGMFKNTGEVAQAPAPASPPACKTGSPITPTHSLPWTQGGDQVTTISTSSTSTET